MRIISTVFVFALVFILGPVAAKDDLFSNPVDCVRELIKQLTPPKNMPPDKPLGHMEEYYLQYYSNDLIPIMPALQHFSLQQSGKLLNMNEVLKVQKEFLDQYVKDIGMDSIEVLHIPASYGHMGHLAIRVEGDVFHIQNGLGIIVEPFSEVINRRYGDYRVYGYLIQASGKEIKKLRFHLMNNLQNPEKAFHLFYNNCSQNVCRALDFVGIQKTPAILALDPSLASMFTARTERMVARTVYNTEKDTSVVIAFAGKLVNRAFFLGALTYPTWPIVASVLVASFGYDQYQKYQTAEEIQATLQKKLSDYQDPLLLSQDLAIISSQIFEGMSTYHFIQYLYRLPKETLDSKLSLIGQSRNQLLESHLWDYLHQPANRILIEKIITLLLIDDIGDRLIHNNFIGPDSTLQAVRDIYINKLFSK